MPEVELWFGFIVLAEIVISPDVGIIRVEKTVRSREPNRAEACLS
ncbi:MAG: hypothetical protein ACR2GC_12085 [Methyloceanibacter sp.]